MDGTDHSGVTPEQEMADRIYVAASTALGATDYKLIRALERALAGKLWCEWRDVMRDAKNNPGKYREPLPPEPIFSPASTDTDEEQCQIIPTLGAPADLAQLMMVGEKLPDTIERLTPGLDELLDLAKLLSEASLETAVSAIQPERFNEWTERLLDEKARLRLRRGTEDENIPRENLINRVKEVFSRVGAKR